MGVAGLSAFMLAGSGAPQAQAPMLLLYDGNLGGTPDTQGFFYQTFPFGGGSATQTYDAGVTTLDTTAVRSDLAGYVGLDMPPLDRSLGYDLHFTVQLLNEDHNGPNRAGFVIVLLGDDLMGIELGFWPDEIWVQEGGVDDLFTHAEGVAFDTTAQPTGYTLSVQDDAYTLLAETTPILSGSLRDYSAFSGPIDPYESPNFLFLGDNSTTSQAATNISIVALESETIVTPTATATQTSMPTVTPENTPTETPSPTQSPTSTPTPAATATPAAEATPFPPHGSIWFPCVMMDE